MIEIQLAMLHGTCRYGNIVSTKAFWTTKQGFVKVCTNWLAKKPVSLQMGIPTKSTQNPAISRQKPDYNIFPLNGWYMWGSESSSFKS